VEKNVEINVSVIDPREIAIGVTLHRSQRVRKQRDVTSKEKVVKIFKKVEKKVVTIQALSRIDSE